MKKHLILESLSLIRIYLEIFLDIPYSDNNIILLLVKIVKLSVLGQVLVIMSKKNIYLQKKMKLLKIINMLKI